MPDDGSYTVGLLSLVEATPPLDRPLAQLRRLHQPRLASSVDFLPPAAVVLLQVKSNTKALRRRRRL